MGLAKEKTFSSAHIPKGDRVLSYNIIVANQRYGLKRCSGTFGWQKFDKTGKE